MGALWFYATLMINYFPITSLTLGMHGSMFIFAGCCFAGTFFILFVVPETKGKSFEEIQRLLKK